MRRQTQVRLSARERGRLEELLQSEALLPRMKRRAKILEEFDESDGRPAKTLAAIAKKHGVSRNTVVRVKRFYLEGGVDKAVYETRPPVGG